MNYTRRWFAALWHALRFRCSHDLTRMTTDSGGNLILRCFVCGRTIATSEDFV